MSRLASRAEVIKLSDALGRDPQQLRFLERIPAEELRSLRTALDDVLFHRQLPMLRHAAAILRWLPRWLVVFLVVHVIGARLGARLAPALPARLLVVITERMPESFVAESIRYADPRRLHDAIQRMPVSVSSRLLVAILDRGDYVSVGRFVEFMPDEAVRALESLVKDDAALVEIAFYMESKNRLEHFLRLLPPQRLGRIMLMLGDPARRALWPKIMLLMTQAGPSLQKTLAEQVVAQDETVLNALVRAVHEEDLFSDVLPVALAVSEEAQRRTANLAVVLEPGVMEAIVRATDARNLWPSELQMMAWTDEQPRALAAAALDKMPEQTLERLVQAAVQNDLWEIVLDLVSRLSTPRQQAFAAILRRMGEVDPELFRRVARQAARYGLALPEP